jgi:hypothetical protein
MLRALPRSSRAVVLAVLAVALLGCRADLVAPIELTVDGGATAGLSVRFDARMLAELDALGVDPTAELGAAVAADPDWELVRTRDDDGALTVSVTRTVADARDLGAVYRDLVAGLSPRDPALLLDLDVDLPEDGGQRVTGTAELRPPVTSGLEVDGDVVGPDADELRALVTEHVTAAVEFRLPGEVETHDGILLDDSTVRFDLEPGEPRPFTVVGSPPSWWSRLDLDGTTVLLLVGGSVALLGVGLLVASRRRVTPAG